MKRREESKRCVEGRKRREECVEGREIEVWRGEEDKGRQ